MDYNFENIATFNVFGYGFQSINLDTYITSKGEKYPNMVLVSHKMIDGLFATLPIKLDKVGVSADEFINEFNRVLNLEKNTHK